MMNEYKLLINGKWRESQLVREIRSPFNQSVRFTTAVSSAFKLRTAICCGACGSPASRVHSARSSSRTDLP